ncbi:salt tolerance down-regulator-domain-containing protein [Halteromyces radiatus]|uniref:salt tolerance down-regulator-domain-containing protein n=1 Tax=Halteromyces radiatus TaxID=101107 RepID=UPI00221F71F5|nr:salt tolerance down-regulator-domain-containing protein [Halteromyces radiatus]KAI8089233.1 salt tolerance down-regulator-domain-containing protein [Halteromyces radiatus]
MQMTKTMATTSTTNSNPDGQSTASTFTTNTTNNTADTTKSSNEKQETIRQIKVKSVPSSGLDAANVDTTTMTTPVDSSSSSQTTTTTKKKKSKLQSFKSLSDATIKSRYSVRSSTSSISIKSTHHHHHHHHHPSPHWLTSFPSPSLASSTTSSSSKKKHVDTLDNDEFWSATSSTEERQKIREFWLQLGEDERRSLVKVEKEAVLRKMKDQQRHGCNCSVCGKKRTAIEDELEVLYDAYYEELEQYANHQQHNQLYGSHTLQAAAASAVAAASAATISTQSKAIPKIPVFPRALGDAIDHRQLQQRLKHKQQLGNTTDISGEHNANDDEDEVDMDDDEDDDEDEFEASTMVTRHGDPDKSLVDVAQYAAAASQLVKSGHSSAMAEHFNFGNSLTVKGGILTVADDLLKNDGRKFLDMMERLAERRIQRDEGISIEGEDEEDDVDDEDDEEYYDEEEDDDNDDDHGDHISENDNEDDDDDDDDEDDEEERYFFNDTRTEEQRIEEGRRMFQIFAARMFEQRVLSAYREKVARERQQRLIQELEEEDRLQKERELKKQKDKEKKKDKKRLLKKQKEEERLAKEAQLKAEEEAQRLERERKEEIERQKREVERQRKEEERQRKEEERQRKEEEKRRRQREEKERRRKEKEEQQRLKQEQQRKEELERQQRLEKQRKEQEEKEELERQRQALEATTLENKETTSTPASTIPVQEGPVTTSTDNNDIPDETRQRVLMNALLGTSGPLASSSLTSSNDLPLDEQRRTSFIPSHLDVLQSSRSPSVDSGNLGSMLSMSPGAPSVLGQGLGGNVGTSLFSPISNPLDHLPGHVNKTRVSIPSVGTIGQPINNERRSFSSTSLAGHIEDSMDSSSPSLKRRSSPGSGVSGINNTSSTQQPIGVENSFFSNFLFGESNQRISSSDHPSYQQSMHHAPYGQPMIPNDAKLSGDINSLDRRFGDHSYNWTNGKFTKKKKKIDDIHIIDY